MSSEVAWFTGRIETPSHPVPVPIRVFLPERPLHRGWLVWAHGGSWHSGSAQAWHQPCAELAATAGTNLVSVDYRLAPQHQHPTALLDLLVALSWARQQADKDDTLVAIGGDSAGATLAACAALVTRDRAETLAAQVLAYPPTDPHCRAASYHRDPTAFPHPTVLSASWRSYLGQGPDISDLYSTPEQAGDLTAAAPAVIAAGTEDPVLDDVRDYRTRLQRNGVPVRYHEIPGASHGAFLHPIPGLRTFLGTELAAVLDGTNPHRQGTAA
jgi:acetyl esterase